MDFSRIKFPLKGKLVLEALEEPDEISGLFIPLEYRERYPQIARVRLVGEGCELRPGAIVVLPNEGIDVLFGSHAYWTVAFVMLFDEGRMTIIQCDVEVFPILRDTVERDRRTGEKHWIRVKTLDGETLAFTSDEVLTYGLDDLSNPGFKLDYVPVAMAELFDLDGRKKLFYFVKEETVLFSMEIEDEDS